MMRIRKFRPNQVFMAVVSVASGMTLLACSKGDTVNNGNNQFTPVVSCGTLSPSEAAELMVARLDHFGTVGIASLAGLENSRAAARVLSFGNETRVDPFVDESQADLHDGLSDFKDDFLSSTSVETSTASSVTFLPDPQKLCESSAPVVSPIYGTGGTQGTGGASTYVDQDCVSERMAHPMRVRISRVACAQGDNVAVEILYGPQSERIVMAELYTERAEIELDLGAFLRNSYSSSTSSSATPGNFMGDGGSSVVVTRTEKPIVTAAVGVIHGTLSLTGTSQANGRVSVTQAIDFTTAEDETRFRLAAGTEVATIAADGAAKTIQVNANVGAFELTTSFKNFIGAFFDLSTKDSASSQQPVAFGAPGFKGSLKLDGTSDTITADGLEIVGGQATATQAGRSLLTISGKSAGLEPVAAVFSGSADDNLNLTLASGLSVDIKYGLEPVMSLVDYPANYLASDTLSFMARPATDVTVMKEQTSNDLAFISSQVGQLLRINAGTLEIRSSVWPSDSVTVQSQQCLARTVVSQTGHNDLLDDFTVGACPQ